MVREIKEILGNVTYVKIVDQFQRLYSGKNIVQSNFSGMMNVDKQRT